MSLTQFRQRTSDVSTSFLVVDLLRFLKQKNDYQALSRLTGLPVSTLTRYVTNKTLPRGMRVMELLPRLLEAVELEPTIRERVRFEDGQMDIASIVTDGAILKLLTAYILNLFKGTRVTAVLATDDLSVPLTTCLGLMTSRRIYLASEKMMSGRAISVTFYHTGTGEYKSLWVSGAVADRRDDILLICGVLCHASKVEALQTKITELGSSVSGVFAIAATADAMAELSIVPASQKACLLAI